MECPKSKAESLKFNFLAVVLFFLSSLAVFFFPSVVRAVTIETSYTDRYTITATSDVLAERKIVLTNTTAKLYVSEYEFSFGNPDIISGLTVTEDTVPADFSRVAENGKLKITVRFKNPAIGNGAKKTLLINYTLLNYLGERGLHHELYVPVSAHSENEELKEYRVEVSTPADFAELSIAKPNPDSSENHLYVWSDVRALIRSNLFIAFAKHAYYNVELKYALPNKAPYAQKMSIPFVPEGMYQKIYVTSINPPPSQTTVDQDDNYLGTYVIPAHSVLTVTFKGIIELSVEPRMDVRTYLRKLIQTVGMSRYLTDEKYWSITESDLQQHASVPLKNPKDIYSFVSSTLSYDTSRISRDLTRMGAGWALQNPSRAVCMEYTDLFIALSREKGIPAREVVGYAVTDNSSLQPLSFFGDILHAWPEYYDRAREIWQRTDPTWGNTAQVDYFSAFDLDHIAFVYHGKDTTFPLPPGVYKIRENTKDVFVSPTEEIPGEDRRIELVLAPTVEFVAGSSNKLHLLLNSKSNVFLYDLKLEIYDTVSGLVIGKSVIDRLEPYGSHEYKVTIDRPFSAGTDKGKFQVRVDNTVIGERDYSVRSPLLFVVNQYKGVLIGVAGGILALIIAFVFFK